LFGIYCHLFLGKRPRKSVHFVLLLFR
jgi:hypothetical protein